MSRKKGVELDLYDTILGFFPEYIDTIFRDLEVHEDHKDLTVKERKQLRKVEWYLKTRPKGRRPSIPENVRFMLRDCIGV